MNQDALKIPEFFRGVSEEMVCDPGFNESFWGPSVYPGCPNLSVTKHKGPIQYIKHPDGPNTTIALDVKK